MSAFLILFAILLAPAAGAQQASDAYPLRGIEIEGNSAYSDEQIAAAIKLKLGQTVRPRDFRQAVHDLGQFGVFETLQFKYRGEDGGYVVTFVVVEIPELYPLRIRGFDETEEELLELLADKLPFFIGLTPPDGPMIDDIGAVLEARWRNTGHDTRVAGRMAPTSEDEFEVVFEPVERMQTIALVGFENTGVLDKLDLQRSFNQVAMGVPYSEARIKELLHHNVRPLYEEQGRMNVTFCPCTTAPDPETEGLLVKVLVDEGDAFTFGTINLPQDTPVEADALGNIIDFQSGDPVNMQAVHDALGEYEEALKRRGYMQGQTILDVEVDKENLRAHLDVGLKLGERHSMGLLYIEGLDILSEPEVRKRWGLDIGEPFDLRYPTLFLDVIRNEGMFDNLINTKWKMETNELEKTVDVTLEFIGKEPEKRRAPDPTKPDIF